MPKRYLVTSALPYANGPLHIGHLAGAYLSADIFVRFLRLAGEEVVFICGSDEHGAAITMRAMKEGVTPQEIIDKYHQLFEKTFQGIGISFDMYHRTSAPIHHETSQDFFRHLYRNGEFEEQESEQYFDESAQQFLADRYITGTCPRCSNPEAYGDQCERCGSSLNPTDLIEPRSVLSGSKPVMRTTRHWFLPLNKHEVWLREWIETGQLNGELHHNPEDWKLHVIGQCKSWLDGGLQPRSMTRDLDWGVDVPQEIPGSKGKKLYVWMDAPIGYISATKQWAADQGKDWELYWKNKDTSLIHFIGKDNIVFHCLIFPAILKTHGDYNLPVNVPANQFMNLEGRKISTSKNWAVWVHEYLEDFPGKEDVLRYVMIRNMPEQRDSEFTWKGFQDSNNNELVNNLGNFVNRVLVLTHKYFEGVVPPCQEDDELNASEALGIRHSCRRELQLLANKLRTMEAYIRKFDFRSALQVLMDVSSAGNQLLQFNEPWKLYKTDPAATGTVLNACIQVVAALRVACRPFMPFTSDTISTFLGMANLQENGEWKDMLDKLDRGESLLPAGHQTGEPAHLFSRIGDEVIELEIQKLHASEPPVSTVSYPPLKEAIQYDDFAKLDIRTGTILTAEKVKGADKLLQLSVDLGFEKRTIVSGIALHFDPVQITGKKVLVVANLAPRKLRGIESQGMILMAEDEAGVLGFVAAPEDWKDGMKIS